MAGDDHPRPRHTPPRLLRIQEVAADTGLTAARHPLLRGARPPRPGRPVGGRVPPLRRGRPRAAPVHPRAARRRRVLARRDRPAARGRGRARPEPRRFRAATDASRAPPDRRRRARHRGPPGRHAAPKIGRLEEMVAEAEDRRAHLVGHLEDLDAGREPAHEHRLASRRAAAHASRERPSIRPSAGFALANGGRAFRHRNYRLFFTGQLVSLVGTWMQQVAQAWLVLELTHDPFVLGLVAGVPARPRARAVRRAHRRRPAQAPHADRHPDRPDGAGVRAVRPRRDRRRAGLADPGHGALLGGSPTPSTCRPARPSPSRSWGARTSPMPSPSTPRSSTGPGSSARRSPASRSASSTPTAFLINGFSFLAIIGALPRCATSELPGRPVMARPRSVGEVRPTLREACATSGAPRSSSWPRSPSASRPPSA